MRINGRFVSALVATAVAVAIGGAALAQLSADERKCSDKINNDARKTIDAEGKGNRKACVKDQTGDQTACVVAVQSGDKAAKLVSDFGAKCSPLPAFGVNASANAINLAVQGASDNVIRDIFGDPVTLGATATGCNDKLAQRPGQLATAQYKAFRSCMKDLGAINNIGDVQTCIASGIAAGTSAKGGKVSDDFDGKCGGTKPAEVLDGACGGAADAAFAQCVIDHTECEVCKAMNTATGANANCTTISGISCAVCGNGVAEGAEQCDGGDLGICPGGATCSGSCQCAPASCDNIDKNGANANSSGTFTVTSTGAPQLGAKYCGGLSAANAFGSCVTDADCGGSAGQCAAIPWLGVATFAPYPITGVSTTFSASAPDAKCVHQATIPCVGATDPCPATPKLGVMHPCCTTPGFKVDTFFIAGLGFCSRVDQTACGGGVVDTSVPMLGDNDIVKVADTSTPLGPNCTYNGSAGETHAACGATEDTLGRIAKTIGNGSFDAAGGHSRFTIPQRSVTWIESSAPPCGPTDTFDTSDIHISDFTLNLETTTATAQASYLDMNGDGISYCGFGPAAFNGTNTLVGAPDLPGVGSRTVAAGTALSGGGPTYDLLFSSITPLTSPVLVAAAPACVPAPPGCPE